MRGVGVTKEPAPANARRVFPFQTSTLAMKFPEALESRMYGNPEDVLAAKQAAEANRKKRDSEREANAPKRRTLTVRKGWAARKAIESLFAGSGAVSAVLSPALPAMEVDPE